MITNAYEIQQLKRFYEELECPYKALLAINVRPEEYSTTMVPKIIGKLPMEVRVKLTEQQDENEDLSIEELVEGLRRFEVSQDLGKTWSANQGKSTGPKANSRQETTSTKRPQPQSYNIIRSGLCQP